MSKLLLESGDALLLESGDALLLEDIDVGGRTTKNTRPYPLGIALGIGRALCRGVLLAVALLHRVWP